VYYDTAGKQLAGRSRIRRTALALIVGVAGFLLVTSSQARADISGITLETVCQQGGLFLQITSNRPVSDRSSLIFTLRDVDSEVGGVRLAPGDRGAITLPADAIGRPFQLSAVEVVESDVPPYANTVLPAGSQAVIPQCPTGTSSSTTPATLPSGPSTSTPATLPGGPSAAASSITLSYTCAHVGSGPANIYLTNNSAEFVDVTLQILAAGQLFPSGIPRIAVPPHDYDVEITPYLEGRTIVAVDNSGGRTNALTVNCTSAIISTTTSMLTSTTLRSTTTTIPVALTATCAALKSLIAFVPFVAMIARMAGCPSTA
jgi:hypothetical protein